jgi:hypothetical protein
MKGYRFYLEFDSPAAKRKGRHQGTVFALSTDSPRFHSKSALGGVCQEGVGSVYDAPNSAVCSCSTSLQRLREDCKAISEKQAREIHPRLFEYLDQD